jgi:hypothetical protein
VTKRKLWVITLRFLVPAFISLMVEWMLARRESLRV